MERMFSRERSYFHGLSHCQKDEKLDLLAESRPFQINTAEDELQINGQVSIASGVNCSYCAVATLIGHGETSTSIYKDIMRGDKLAMFSDKECPKGFSRYYTRKYKLKTHILKEGKAELQRLGIKDYLESRGFCCHMESSQSEVLALAAMESYPLGTRFIVFSTKDSILPPVCHIIYAEKRQDVLYFIDAQPTPFLHYIHRPKIFDQEQFYYADSIGFIAVTP